MFLFEFFEDTQLAFFVFSVVWSAELFNMVCVRADARLLWNLQVGTHLLYSLLRVARRSQGRVYLPRP